MKLTMAAIIGAVGSSIAASAAFAVPIVGFGAPIDVIVGGTVIDFEAVATDAMPIVDSSTSVFDPRVGARTSLDVGSGLVISGVDTSTSAGPRPGSLFVTSGFVLTEFDAGAFALSGGTDEFFNLYTYDGAETFNTSGNFLMNWDKTDYTDVTFIQPHTNEIVFTLATAVDRFAFNFGANDNAWRLEAFDEFDNLLDSLDIAAHATTAASDGQYYGLATAGMRKLVLSDTFVANNGDGTSTTCNPNFNEKCGEWVVLDNVTFGNATSVVPIPGALPLLLGALGVFGIMARRRA
jgi:hypothetical protein